MNNFKLSIIFLSAFSFLSSLSYAQALPETTSKDLRVQDVIYNPNDVTSVKVKTGTATLVQLGEGEYIGGDNAGFATGDPLAWDVSIKGNNIFLRPKAPQHDTNVIFQSNKRTYLMTLTSVTDPEEDPTFILRYKYPQDEHEKKQLALKARNAEAVQVAKKKNEQLQVPCTEGTNINMSYMVRGSLEAQPLAVWDDGRFTCFKFPQNISLPVIYALDGNNERITNSHMNKNIMVVHEVSKRFMLRAGEDVVEVKTEQNVPRSYNAKGTTTHEFLRDK